MAITGSSLITVVFATSNQVQVPIEEYVKGVVAAEMHGWFETEALKLQAITARSVGIEVQLREGYVKASIAVQAYNPANRTLRTDFAVDETAGIVGVHNGKVAYTFYSASCGGAHNQ